MNNTTETPVQKSVFIIDGSSFLYRAYYSIRPLTTSSGIPVQAIYGFCRMIKKLIDKYQPEYIVLVWDSKGPTVRHELYEGYKKTRQAAPSDLISQKEIIQEFADILGLVQLSMPGVEADDLMFSLAKRLEQEGASSILVTSDKDMGQALNNYVSMLDPFKEQLITQEILEEKMGFSVSKLPFYYALVGDSADNIPGVRGIGPKAAQTLVKQFSALQELYDNLDKIASERIRQLLTQAKADAFLSLELFLLRIYETTLTYRCCGFLPERWAQARPFFEKYEFYSLLKQLDAREQVPKVLGPALHERYTFVLVNTPELLNQVCNELEQYKRCAFDTESTGLKPFESQLIGISLCMTSGIAYYIPFGHSTEETQLDRQVVLEQLKPLFEDVSIEKYAHNAKFDTLMLDSAGITIKNLVFDTLIAAGLLVTEGQRIGLKYLSEYYFQESMLFWNEVVKKNKYTDFSQVPLSLATEYAAADAHQTLKLYNLLSAELKQQNLYILFSTLEMPLIPVLCAMEKRGIIIDTQVLKALERTVSQEIAGLNALIVDMLGENFATINLNSPKQLEDVLFNYLKLPAVKKTLQKTAYSTDQAVLKELALLHPVPGLIMRYRELHKIRSTYLEGLQQAVNPTTGRAHTTFSQTVVVTGRLSSSDPNLQNIPVDKYHIRAAFKASQDFVFVSADYSQIELRVLAYISQDPVLLEAFAQNRDIHALTASGLFNVPLEQVTHEQRQIGKRINFSIIYGLTPHGLSKDLHISYATAKNYIDNYMAQYPGVRAWMDIVIAQAHEQGYVTTLWGRKRATPGIYEKNKHLYELARRVAINTVVQGTAAELTKWGMLALYNYFREHTISAHVLLQIHDELLIEVPYTQQAEITQVITELLQTIVTWNVPLVITTRTGNNWQEVTK